FGGRGIEPSEELGKVPADRLVRLIPQQRPRAGVPRQDLPRIVDDDHGIVREIVDEPMHQIIVVQTRHCTPQSSTPQPSEPPFRKPKIRNPSSETPATKPQLRNPSLHPCSAT